MGKYACWARKEWPKGMERNSKIVGIGACVMDTLVGVPTYPEEDTKMKAAWVKDGGGGPVATGLTAAARLGIPAGYIGVLADDYSGVFLKRDFEKYGVDVSNVEIKRGFRSFTSTVWLSVKDATRTCVFDRGNLPDLVLDREAEEAISEAEILMIDGNEMEAAQRGCHVARERGTKVLYDCGGLYQDVESLLALTDIMIPSAEFAVGHTGCTSLLDAARKLYEMYRPEVVVVTRGEEGCILYDGSDVVCYPAFLVKAVDTNGCGDVFHGAFAAGVVKGLAYGECCIYASAVSAIKCTGVGARESVPDSETVERFLFERGYGLFIRD